MGGRQPHMEPDEELQPQPRALQPMEAAGHGSPRPVQARVPQSVPLLGRLSAACRGWRAEMGPGPLGPYGAITWEHRICCT